MKKSLLALSVSIVLLNISGVAQAKTDIAATTNVAAGKAKSASCAGCHGEDGNSMMPLFPKLADQNEEYLVKQMEAFKDGTRTDATMSAMVAGLSTQDMQDIAAFYEKQKVTQNTLPPLELDDEEDEEESAVEETLTEEEALAAVKEKEEANKQTAQEQQDTLLALGYDVYRNGDLEREISACIACHGPYGEGNKPASFPALQGQHADYLIKTLTDFKNNVRSNDPDNMMHMIANKMTDEEIKGIAYHVSVMKSN